MSTKLVRSLWNIIASCLAVLILGKFCWLLVAQELIGITSGPDAMYAAHFERVMKDLPAESGPPPLLDLSKGTLPGASEKWEKRFTGSMGVRPITDTGSLDTSISLTTTDFVGSPPALPIRTSIVVAIGTPLLASAHLASNRRFVYSLYTLRLEEIWKDQREKSGKQNTEVVCGLLGGSIRFPSGHQETFLESREGFLKLNARYVLFLWQPIPHDQTYMVSEAFLLLDGKVFPVKVNFDRDRFGGMPEDKLRKIVKDAVRDQKDVM